MAELIRGLGALNSAFDLFIKEVEANQTKAIKLTANEFQTDVKKEAPYKTSTYRRLIHTEVITPKMAIVGTNLPYAKRLEYGFADTDSLGRTYNQLAQPHWRPALDNNMSKYKKIYKDAVFS